MMLTFTSRVLALLRRWASNRRIFLARATGSEIGRGCSLAAGCDAQLGFAQSRRGSITIGPRCVLENGVVLSPYGGSIRLGEDVYLGPSVVIFGHGGVKIGPSTLVAMHCRIVSSNHPILPRGMEIRSKPDVLLPTRIGRDVWLGAGVTVLGGVTIGEGCVVGAGSVVTHDLAPYAIAHGVPAQIVRERGSQSP